MDNSKEGKLTSEIYPIDSKQELRAAKRGLVPERMPFCHITTLHRCEQSLGQLSLMKYAICGWILLGFYSTPIREVNSAFFFFLFFFPFISFFP